MSAPTQIRNQVAIIAKTNSLKAYEISAKIMDPWYRTQAMAHTARWANGKLFEKAIGEAQKSALKCENPFKKSSVLAWVINAAQESGNTVNVEKITKIAIKLTKEIEDESSRVESLMLLWQAAYSHEASREAIFLKLLPTAKGSKNWRCKRALNSIVSILSRDYKDRALEIVNSTPGEQTKTKLLKLIEGESVSSPRPFFW